MSKLIKSSSKLAKGLSALLGVKGEKWLTMLDQKLDIVLQDWNAVDFELMDVSKYNCLIRFASLNRGERLDLLLKSSPLEEDLAREALMLEYLRDTPVPEILEFDSESSVIVREFVLPGDTLGANFPEDDDKETEIAAEIISQIALIPKTEKPCKEENFNSIPQILKILDADFLPKEMLTHTRNAKSVSQDLLLDNPDFRILHGDIHHKNILDSSVTGGKHVVIDPKGIIGPIEYEVSTFVRNPIEKLLLQTNATNIMRDRVEIFADILNLDKEIIFHWVYIQSVLSTCWAIDDGFSEDAEMWMKSIGNTQGFVMEKKGYFFSTDEGGKDVDPSITLSGDSGH